jgi:hypothetical protein
MPLRTILRAGSEGVPGYEICCWLLVPRTRSLEPEGWREPDLKAASEDEWLTTDDWRPPFSWGA